MNTLRYSSLALLVALSPAGFAQAQDMQRLAHSTRLGVEILAKKNGDKWCQDTVELNIKAQNPAFFSSADFDNTVKQVGSILAKDCPAATTAKIEGFAASGGNAVWQGVAAAKAAWKPEKSGITQTAASTAPAATPSSATPAPQPAAVQNASSSPSGGAPQALSVDQLDIAGLKLGMSRSEVEAVAKRHNSKFDIDVDEKDVSGTKFLQVILFRDGKKIVPTQEEINRARPFKELRTHWDSMREIFATEFRGPSGAEKTVAVGRGLYFEQGKEPVRDSLVAGLIAKYKAEPTWISPNGNELYWYFDKGGRFQSKQRSSNFGGCELRFGGGANYTWYPTGYSPSGDGASVRFSSGYTRGCGTNLSVKLMPVHNNPGLVREAQFTLFNETAYYDALTEQPNLERAAANKKQDEELEKARRDNRGPKL